MERYEYRLEKIDQPAKKILKYLKPGDILALSGPLASGKTTLAQAILRQMDYHDRVSSPTFVIEHRYPVKFKKIKEVIHLDFYRLNREHIAQFDWAEYKDDHGQLTIIEWPERAARLLPHKAKKIKIEEVDVASKPHVFYKKDDQIRRLTFSNNFTA